MKIKENTTLWSTFFFLILSTASLIIYYSNRIYPNVYTAGLPLGGLTYPEAVRHLSDYLKMKYPKTFYFRHLSQTMEIDLSRFSARVDINHTVNNAYALGRTEDLINNLKTVFKTARKPANLPLDLSLNEEKLRDYFSTVSAAVNEPKEAPYARIDEAGKITIYAGRDGQSVDTESVARLLVKNLSENPDTNSMILPVVKEKARLDDQEIAAGRKRLEKLYLKSLNLAYPGDGRMIAKNELLNFLNLPEGYNFDYIASFSAALATGINSEPREALFKFENGRVTEFKASKEGKKLNEPETVKFIAAGLLKLENTAQAVIDLTLPVLITPPRTATGQANNFGVKELIGAGSSKFTHSIPQRTHNIILAAGRVSGTLLFSGETFSFNKAVGDISQTTGYAPAYVIKEGKTVLGDGGGVCQVSTTLFRAALAAGLPVVERHSHAYRVGYYEQDKEPGFDATVFAPSVDLKFKNNTPAAILIQAVPDEKNFALTFELYGAKDGRSVSVSRGRLWDQIPPPPDLYQDDPTLTLGAVKQIDFSAWGAKAAFDYKVVKNEEKLTEMTFYSFYRPWQAIFLKGTKI